MCSAAASFVIRPDRQARQRVAGALFSQAARRTAWRRENTNSVIIQCFAPRSFRSTILGLGPAERPLPVYRAPARALPPQPFEEVAMADQSSITIDSITPAERAASLRRLLNNFGNTVCELQYQVALRDQTITKLQRERDRRASASSG
jgi:hypothetical protein